MLDFRLNQKYIAQTLCENRDKPCCHCHGKCYLKKQLEKSDKEQGLPASNSQKDGNEVLFLAEEKTTAFDHYFEQIKKVYSIRYNSFSPQNLYGSVFHPPQV